MDAVDYQLFNKFSDSIRTIYPKMEQVSEESVSILQMGYLHFLLDHDGCCQQDLADMRIAGKATISEMLQNMEEKQLITRVRNQDNRRKVQIHLTEKGQRIARKIKKEYIAFCERSMSDFTEEEKKQFFYLMRKFVNS